MTDGIVSALDRIVTVDRSIINTFQLSAAVNSGNSGGPVYNRYGEVIGIVTAKMTRGSVEGIGFAIPINDAIEIAKDLIEYGYISGRALLGIQTRTITPGHAQYYDRVAGALVISVNDGSAAERAGMHVGDIIIKVGENEVETLETLRFALRMYEAGDTATITVWRDSEVHELEITFDEDLHAGQPNRH
jgi:serine protease Do